MAEADSVPVATRLPARLLAKLDRIARELGGTRSDALRRLVEEYGHDSTIRADSPLFAPTLRSDPDAPALDFAGSRYERVAKRGRR